MKEMLETQEYIVFPEAALRHLPEEWQKYFIGLIKEGQGILETADENLKMLNRLIHAFPTMASLRYIQHRLASTKFEATMERIFEIDMLILAFVTTYVRLIEGGIGSGVSRKALPVKLRPVHDKIIELRNKRYAHNDGHDSVAGILSISFEDGKFDISAKFQMDFQIGGALEWEHLVVFLDRLMFDRLLAQLEMLKKKTGREWIFPRGNFPEWISSGPDT